MDPTLVALVGVVIAAAAGLGGALLGSWISAGATRRAAEISQAEARADREEGRRARFADRIRELAAEIITRGHWLYVAVHDQADARRANPTGRPPVVAFDSVRFEALCQELRIIARGQQTRNAIDRFNAATSRMASGVVRSSEAGVYHIREVDDAELARLQEAFLDWHAAGEALEEAIALELGTWDPEE